MRRIRIFDTTLRDGEQSPGVNLMREEKIEIARQLERLGVDIIEAGFPITSSGDMEAVQAIAREVRSPVIAGLARTHRADIEAAAKALEQAARPRIHVFTSFSPVHLRHMLRKTEDEVIEMSVASIEAARTYVDDVEFSGQDAMRSDPAFVFRAIAAAIAAGATTINIPDTVGYTAPEEFAALVRAVRDKVPGADRVHISVHCHNDLGLAVANTLAGLMAGADQCEAAVNGIGERAGNTSLEEVAMAIATRQDFFRLQTGIAAQEIGRTSRLVSRLTGMPVQPNKAIVGANAFAHEAGIHQDGVLKERTTYEIMNPQDIGQGETQLVMGKHSGRHAFQKKLLALGYDLPEAEQQELFRNFKALTDRKKQVTDQDIQSLVEDEIYRFEDAYELVHYHISSAGGAPSTATVGVASRSGAAAGKVTREAAVGQGPVEALYRALQRATGLDAELRDYAIQSVGGGSDAQGEVRCSIGYQGQTFVGSGVSTDILEASAFAYLHALNKAAAVRAQAEPQEPTGREAI